MSTLGAFSRSLSRRPPLCRAALVAVQAPCERTPMQGSDHCLFQGQGVLLDWRELPLAARSVSCQKSLALTLLHVHRQEILRFHIEIGIALKSFTCCTLLFSRCRGRLLTPSIPGSEISEGPRQAAKTFRNSWRVIRRPFAPPCSRDSSRSDIS